MLGIAGAPNGTESFDGMCDHRHADGCAIGVELYGFRDEHGWNFDCEYFNRSDYSARDYVSSESVFSYEGSRDYTDSSD